MKEHKSWRTRLDEAKKRGEFTAKDVIDMGDWPTCFIGERFHANSMARGVSEQAKELGIEAMRAVNFGNIRKAIDIYLQIQKLPKSEGEA